MSAVFLKFGFNIIDYFPLLGVEKNGCGGCFGVNSGDTAEPLKLVYDSSE